MPIQEDEKDIVGYNSTVLKLGSVPTPMPYQVLQNDWTRRVKKAANEKQVQPLGDPDICPGISLLRPLAISDSQYRSIGAWGASSISEHHISAIDCPKYHLRRRTKDRVVFSFLDAWEQELAKTDNEFIDHDQFLMASPFDPRMAHANPAHVVGVSKDFRDVIHTLGGASKTNWFDDTHELVQNIFKDAGVRGYLTNASPEDFCIEYHHHTDGEFCYTAVAEHPPDYFVNLLYATDSNNELLTLPKHAASLNSVAGMTYSTLGAMEDFDSANSAPETLEAEKLVLEMEMRLDLAKTALLKARKGVKCTGGIV